MNNSVYECMFLLDTSKVAGDIPSAAEKLHAILEKNHAEILASRPWEERRLAYPVENQKKGLYYLMYFTTDGKNITPMEQDFRLNDMILRTMILKIEPQLVETMLKLARDEHALALRNYHDEDDIKPNEPRRDASVEESKEDTKNDSAEEKKEAVASHSDSD